MRIVIDANGYRERRAELLREEPTTPRTRRCATGRRWSSSRCRRPSGGSSTSTCVTAVDVETHSEGDEPERYLVVTPPTD